MRNDNTENPHISPPPTETIIRLPNVEKHRTTNPRFEGLPLGEIPPGFDLENWEEVGTEEVGYEERDQYGTSFRLIERIVATFRKIEHITDPDYLPDHDLYPMLTVPVATPEQSFPDRAEHFAELRRQEAVIRDFLKKVIRSSNDPSLQAELAASAAARTPSQKRWFSGLMGKISELGFTRKMLAAIMGLTTSVFMGMNEGISKPKPEKTPSGPTIPPDMPSNEEDPPETKSHLTVLKRTNEHSEIRPVNLRNESYTAQFSHSPHFEVNKEQTVEARREINKLIDLIRLEINNAKENNQSVTTIEIDSETPGASIRRRFDVKESYEKNINYGSDKKDPAFAELQTAIQAECPGISVLISKRDRDSIVVDGIKYTLRQAEEQARKIFGINSGKDGDNKLYHILKRWDDGDRSGFTEEESKFLIQVMDDARNIRAVIRVLGEETVTTTTKIDSVRRTSEEETHRPRRPKDDSAPIPAPPVPVPQPYGSVKLFERDPFDHQQFDPTPQPDEPAGERPRRPRLITIAEFKTTLVYSPAQTQQRHITLTERTVYRRKKGTVEPPPPPPDDSVSNGQWAPNIGPIKAERTRANTASQSGGRRGTSGHLRVGTFGDVPDRSTGMGTYGRQNEGYGKTVRLDEAGHAIDGSEAIFGGSPSAHARGQESVQKKERLENRRQQRRGHGRNKR